VLGVRVLWFDADGLVRKEHRLADKATLVAQDDKRAKPGSFRPPPPAPGDMETHTAKVSPDEDKLADIAHQLFAAVEAKKENDVLALLADDFVFEDLALPRAFTGPKDAKALYAALAKTLPDAKVTTLSLGVDDLVATEGELTATIKPGDKIVHVHFVTVLRIKNGKVVKGWRYTNAAELADQLHPPHPASKKAP
jgi:ketosteroid isomerase-like protein